jgi:pimeloyl-ACP methyl ester carboxylesterase
MSVPKPTIVVIPGAWHSPSHFDRLLAFFHEADHPTVSLALPSLNPETPKKIEVATDVAFIREKMLLPLLEDGKDIVLVMHSYGGVPGGAAAKELSKSERSSQGQRGGIIGMIFIAAILTGEGDSLLSLAGGQWPPWVVVNVR